MRPSRGLATTLPAMLLAATCLLLVFNVRASHALGTASAKPQGYLSASAPNGDTIQIDPWGLNAVRVRIAKAGTQITENPGALIPPGSDNKGAVFAYDRDQAVRLHHDSGSQAIQNGNIKASISPNGNITIERVGSKVGWTPPFNPGFNVCCGFHGGVLTMA